MRDDEDLANVYRVRPYACESKTGILTTNPDGKLEYQIINEWQLCPKCNGTGLTYQTGGWPPSETIITTGAYTCDLCNGKMIISKVDGLPPKV